jgi:hypothetical protein
MLLLKICNSNLVLFRIATFERNYDMNYTNYDEKIREIKK